ncbi:MAG: molecular chaperone HtpG, partial [Minwuiales bacterium]|nr:molecular chaperone HtpG [Minwuiales bacterium]
MTAETLSFQAEVSKLLHIVTHSLYSEKEIFLRELISNASDACDRLRYLASTNPELTADDPGFKVTVTVDAKAKTLSVADNGIGMNRDDMVENLGTIARSGSGAFLEQLTGDADKDISLIGQFGVGFYSAFMVADKVEVVSRKAGEDQAWRWVSDGGGDFSIEEAERQARGTTVTMTLRKDAAEFLELDRLRQIVKTYSNHIALPIEIVDLGKEGDAEPETINQASAIWTRPKSEITAEQYTEFYRHVGHGFDEPWLTLHSKAEGKIEYTMLLFVPTMKPFDLFSPERKHGVKLYVKRVFITDDCEDLVPSYMRFLRGVVDSEDL